MNILEFEDGQLISPGYVVIGEQQYQVVEAVYSGNTPVSAMNLNNMQKNLITSKYSLEIDSDKTAEQEITIPCYYKVGEDVLDVYLNGERLLKSSDDSGTDGHYREIGDIGSISNKIKTTTDWNLEADDVLDLVVRGEYNAT